MSHSPPPPLTVSQLAAMVRQVVGEHMPAPIRVVGEISNFTNRTHCFFSLKDDAATIRCVCFASNVRRLKFTPSDGMAVVATGRVDYYDAQGHLQLYVEKLEPVGQGALEMQFRALCDELRRLGYFDVDRKKPLPVMPRTIAVVTSRSGAALQDVINTTRRRCPGCRLLLFDVRVQGAAAAPEIAAALNALSRFGPRLDIDAVILTRGGGSIEDLWAFNERIVADAVFRCTLPIVAAIGHETDTTIAELVADARCATPTQAAMTLVPDRAAVEHQLSQLSHRLRLLVRRQVDHEWHRVRAAARHPALKRPDRMLQPVRLRLQELKRRLHVGVRREIDTRRDRVRAAARHPALHRPDRMLQPVRLRLQALSRRLHAAPPRVVQQASRRVTASAERVRIAGPRAVERARQRIEALSRQLQAVSPRHVLERGYSYTLDAAGHVIRRAADVAPGAAITTVLAEGQIISTVEGDATETNSPQRESTPTPAPNPRRRRRPTPPSEPSLFA